jgi:hypothetical protein
VEVRRVVGGEGCGEWTGGPGSLDAGGNGLVGSAAAKVVEHSLMDHEERAVDRLIELGYLKYVAPAEKPSIRQELLSTLRQGYLDSAWDRQCISRDRRSYPADSEELAEGRMGDFLLSMKAVLQTVGVQLESIEDDVDDQHYDLLVNGERHAVYDADVLANAWIWVVATKRFLEIVNELLKRVGSKERLYGIYGGNDGRVILLTDEMYELLHAPDLKIDPGWMPYPPVAIRRDGSVER